MSDEQPARHTTRTHHCPICDARTWHDPTDGVCIRCGTAFPELAAVRRRHPREAQPVIVAGWWKDAALPREDDA